MKSSKITLIVGILLVCILTSCSSAQRYKRHKPKKPRRGAACDCPTFGEAKYNAATTYIFNV